MNKTRTEVNALIESYGYMLMTYGDETAIKVLADTLNGAKLDRAQLSMIAAFAVRRLFNKRSDLVKLSVN